MDNSPDRSSPLPHTQLPHRIFKIIVIGDSNVGKTCLTYRFCLGRFLNRVETTIGVDFHEKEVSIDGETVKLQLWDTAGQERFRQRMVPHYYRSAHAVVFVFDVSSRASFEALPQWVEECDRYHLSTALPRIVIGNKCDVPDAQVSTQEAQHFADSHDMPLFETSAKDESRANQVKAIFLTLAQSLMNSQPSMEAEDARQRYLVHLSKQESVGETVPEKEAQSRKCSC